MEARVMKVRLSVIVAVAPSGALVLDCGHLAVRRNRRRHVLCEKCNPAAYAARVARARGQRPS